jgi:DNA polymerase-3 subunit alpha
MRSKRGARWAIYTLQDRTGAVELLAFPEAFARLEPMMRAGTPLLIKGRVNVEEVGTRVAVADARALEQSGERTPSLLRVRVDLGVIDSIMLDRLQELLRSRPGRCRVAFELVNLDGSVATLEAQSGVQPDRDLVEAVREICGLDAVAVL